MSQPRAQTPSGRPLAGQPADPTAGGAARPGPGLPEIVVGLAIWTAGVFLLAPQLQRLGLTSQERGLALAGLAGVFGPAALAAACALRIRSLPPFGFRGVERRWLLIALGVGLVTLVVKSLASGVWILLSGDTENAQSAYAEGASGGALALVLATLFLGVLTPLGEEFLFRGVVTTGLLHYGPVVGVGGSALVFALFHGINPVLPGAFVIGLATAELLRRTGSVWPGVVVHVVVNLPAPVISVVAGLN